MARPHLYTRPPAYVGDAPFDGDIFDRKPIAERLTGYVERLHEGAVFGIDAPWGAGKTWFALNWHAELRIRGFEAVYLDAFQHDFSDDPFLIIASEIIGLAETQRDEGSRRRLLEKAATVGKKILPLGAKAAINIAARVTLGADGLEELKDALGNVPDDVAKAAEKYVDERLQSQNINRRAVESFRQALAEFATRQDKPVVFIIDELDRCKPPFAVQLVERIKHFFDAKNLVFVLFLNREQLEAAVQGVYGSRVNAAGYLGKFVQFFLTLPKGSDDPAVQGNFAWRYSSVLAKRHGYDTRGDAGDFVDHISFFGTKYRLSLRDLERAFILYGMAQPVRTPLAAYMAYVIVLKMAHPDVFRGIVTNSKAAHNRALELLEPVLDGGKPPQLAVIRDLHRDCIETSAGRQGVLSEFWSATGISPANAFNELTSRIDFPVS